MLQVSCSVVAIAAFSLSKAKISTCQYDMQPPAPAVRCRIWKVRSRILVLRCRISSWRYEMMRSGGIRLNLRGWGIRHPTVHTIATEVELHLVLAQHLVKARSDTAVTVFAPDVKLPLRLADCCVYFIHLRLRRLHFRFIFQLKITMIQ